MSVLVFLGSVLLGLFYLVQCQQQPPPIRLSPTVTESISLTCPTLDANAHNELIRQGIQDYDRHKSAQSRPCSCGGKGWTRVAYLDMNDTSQQCPSSWGIITNPIRGCGQEYAGRLGGCNSVTYPVHGLTYSQVCGRILAYQHGLTSAFISSIQNDSYTIEDPYLSGVSLTHGPPGSRLHVWSFAAGVYYQDFGYSYVYNELCPCVSATYPYQVPSFISNNSYFCDSKNPGSGGYSSTTIYSEAPLWDGQGCGINNRCCDYNSPPWFCTSLPQPTNDDLEIRSCYSRLWYHEDIYI